jgi:hypothetical protein
MAILKWTSFHEISVALTDEEMSEVQISLSGFESKYSIYFSSHEVAIKDLRAAADWLEGEKENFLSAIIEQIEYVSTEQLIPMRRVWAMPSPATFSIRPISELLDRWLQDCRVIVDPFCGDSLRATIRNDLKNGFEARMFLAGLDCQADAVLFDPPYSPRQIAESYKSVGMAVGQQETQNARLYGDVKDGLDRILRPGGIAICCGWNSAGFGKERGYKLEEILLVAHGGAHNDTIVTVERKGQ